MFNQADLQPHRSSWRINILNDISYKDSFQPFKTTLLNCITLNLEFNLAFKGPATL